LETELYTATKVASLVFERGLARVDRPADVGRFIRQHAYQPTYKDLLT
jgi:malate dehydrogenase (oxaloacetate-decarboxylating)(NADP+)